MANLFRKKLGKIYRACIRRGMRLLDRIHLAPNCLAVRSVKVDPKNKCRVLIKFEVTGEWKRYIEYDRTCFFEYSEPVDSVPVSILVVPFLANILPLVWVKHARILVPACDQDFTEAIPKLQAAYAAMYPEQKFRGKVRIRKTEENHKPVAAERTAVMFSGGLDAYATLIRHVDEIDDLFMILGADIGHRNKVGTANMKRLLQDAAEQFGKEGLYCRTSIRTILRKSKLDPLVKHPGETWWHGYQHGIGMLSQLAPLAYRRGIRTLYIASSFTQGQKHVCASDPSIDNHVSFCGCQVIHDAYELNRVDKINLVGNYANQTGRDLFIRACNKSKEALNCCKCEKCTRTILGFWSCGLNPIRFGFRQEWSPDKLGEALLKKKRRFPNKFRARYMPIQTSMRQTYKREEVPEKLKWLYDYKFSEP